MNNILPFYDEERVLASSRHDDTKNQVAERLSQRNVFIGLGVLAFALPVVTYAFLSELVS